MTLGILKDISFTFVTFFPVSNLLSSSPLLFFQSKILDDMNFNWAFNPEEKCLNK